MNLTLVEYTCIILILQDVKMEAHLVNHLIKVPSFRGTVRNRIQDSDSYSPDSATRSFCIALKYPAFPFGTEYYYVIPIAIRLSFLMLQFQ